MRNSELLQLLEGALEDVEVDLLADAWQLALVAMLPEGPRTAVAQAVYIVMGYPVGIDVEHRVVHILLAEGVVGVENGLHLVVLLHSDEPLEDALPESLDADIGRLHLHIEYGREVALLQLHMPHKVLGLQLGGGRGAIEMIGTTHDAKATGSGKVALELTVDNIAALGGLDEDERERHTVDVGLVAQQLPVDSALMMADIDSVHGETLRRGIQRRLRRKEGFEKYPASDAYDHRSETRWPQTGPSAL